MVKTAKGRRVGCLRPTYCNVVCALSLNGEPRERSPLLDRKFNNRSLDSIAPQVQVNMAEIIKCEETRRSYFGCSGLNVTAQPP